MDNDGGCENAVAQNEPNSIGRRDFLELSIFAITGLVAAVVAPPLLASFIGPSFQLTGGGFTKVGSLKALKAGIPTNLGFTATTTDAYIAATEMHSVWVVKGPQESLSVFSPICPHLGCQYDWNNSASQFQCPCHGSFFAADGRVLGGPAPRPLDTLPYEVKKGELYVKWERFKVGIPQKEQA